MVERFVSRGIILDDHALFARGLNMLLADTYPKAEFTVHTNPSEAIRMIGTLGGDVDLILTDFYMPGHDPIEVLSALRAKAPHASIIVVSATLSPEDQTRATAQGIDAFVGKHIPPEQLLGVIRANLAGDTAKVANLKVTKANHVDRVSIFAQIGLTKRQGEIAVMVCNGLSNREVAERLGVSPETIKTHLSSIYRDCKVSGRIDLINWCRKHGLSVGD